MFDGQKLRVAYGGVCELRLGSFWLGFDHDNLELRLGSFWLGFDHDNLIYHVIAVVRQFD